MYILLRSIQGFIHLHFLSLILHSFYIQVLQLVINTFALQFEQQKVHQSLPSPSETTNRQLVHHLAATVSLTEKNGIVANMLLFMKDFLSRQIHERMREKQTEGEHGLTIVCVETIARTEVFYPVQLKEMVLICVLLKKFVRYRTCKIHAMVYTCERIF